MQTETNRENIKPDAGRDLGQITIHPTRFEPLRIDNAAGGATRIAVNYYGTKLSDRPAEDAQISMGTAGFDACVHLRPHELRLLASYLTKAACLIEENEALYDMSKYHFGG